MLSGEGVFVQNRKNISESLCTCTGKCFVSSQGVHRLSSAKHKKMHSSSPNRLLFRRRKFAIVKPAGTPTGSYQKPLGNPRFFCYTKNVGNRRVSAKLPSYPSSFS
jgi:hypothetical protein